MSVAQTVEQVVEEFTQASRMFTAFDVTKEVRQRGHRAKHADVKAAVHDLFEQRRLPVDYTRTLVDLPGVSVQPWCYHPDTSDPTTYQPGGPAAGMTVTQFYQGSGTNPAPTPAPSPPAGLAAGRLPDARGTLCVPAGLLRKAGFVPRATAHVSISGGTIVVQKTSQGGGSTYTVDDNNNVRITRHTLAASGVPAANGYDFEGHPDRVVVKPA